MSDKPRLINGQWVRPPAGGWAKRGKVSGRGVAWSGAAQSAEGHRYRVIGNLIAARLRDLAGPPAKGPRKPKG
jgi:hypothetical protein